MTTMQQIAALEADPPYVRALHDAALGLLRDAASTFESGGTENTGRLIGGDRDHTMTAGFEPPLRRIGGNWKELFPFLAGFPQAPGAIAAAIRKGSGKLYGELLTAAREWADEKQAQEEE